MNEDRLIGWLVFIRLQWDDDKIPSVPTVVQDALAARGWFTCGEDPELGASKRGHITDAGITKADLEAPEWGIDPIPCEAGE